MSPSSLSFCTGADGVGSSVGHVFPVLSESLTLWFQVH